MVGSDPIAAGGKGLRGRGFKVITLVIKLKSKHAYSINSNSYSNKTKIYTRLLLVHIGREHGGPGGGLTAGANAAAGARGSAHSSTALAFDAELTIS